MYFLCLFRCDQMRGARSTDTRDCNGHVKIEYLSAVNFNAHTDGNQFFRFTVVGWCNSVWLYTPIHAPPTHTHMMKKNTNVQVHTHTAQQCNMRTHLRTRAHTHNSDTRRLRNDMMPTYFLRSSSNTFGFRLRPCERRLRPCEGERQRST